MDVHMLLEQIIFLPILLGILNHRRPLVSDSKDFLDQGLVTKIFTDYPFVYFSESVGGLINFIIGDIQEGCETSHMAIIVILGFIML